MAKLRKRNDTRVTWPYWILGSVAVVGGIVGANYAVHKIVDYGKPRWKFCIRAIGSLDQPIGYEIVVTDPQGNSGLLRPKLEDGSFEAKTWWQARNIAHVYIECRGGVGEQSKGACPTPTGELLDNCAV